MCSYIFIITWQSILSTVLFTVVFSFTTEHVLVLRYNCDISLYKCTISLTSLLYGHLGCFLILSFANKFTVEILQLMSLNSHVGFTIG